MPRTIDWETPSAQITHVLAHQQPAVGVVEPVQMTVAELSALTALNSVVVYETRAELFADLAWPANSIGFVFDDPTPALNGTYKKSGISGAGSWARIGDLPALADLTALNAAILAEEARAKTQEYLLQFPYEFSDSTTGAATPNGVLKLNHATPSSVTQIRIDYEDRDGEDREDAIAAWLAFTPGTIQGRLKIIHQPAPYRFAEYLVTNVTDSTGYFTLDVTYVASANTPFTDGVTVVARFQLSADRDVAALDAATTAALAAKAPLASPALTGNPTAPTQAAGNNTTRLATTAFVQAAIDAILGGVSAGLDTLAEIATALGLKANIASPTFTGTPAAPTAAPGTDTTQLATTGFVKAAIDVVLGGVASGLDTLAEIATALGLKASTATTITGGGIATGGGSLAADRTITVTKATAAEIDAVVDASGEDAKAATPASLLPIKQAAWTWQIHYKFLNTTTSAQPPTGKLKFNAAFSAGYASVTEIRISDDDAPGASRLSLIQTWNGLRIKVTQRANSVRWAIFRVTSQSHTDHTLLNVVHLRDSGQEFTDDADLVVAYWLGSDADTAGLAPLASPAFTGNPTAPTQSVGNNTTRLATTAFVQNALDALLGGVSAGFDTLIEIANAIGLKANIASPTFTGTPAAPTATVGTDTTQLATTAFANDAADAAVAIEEARAEAVEDAKVDRAPAPSAPISSVSPGRTQHQSSDGVVVLLQRPDGSIALGPTPAHDWHVEVRGPTGSRHVWAIAATAAVGGMPWEFQVSTAHDGDDNFAPKLEGMRLSWIAETAGTKTVKTAIMAASIAGLSGSVTEMRGITVNGQSTSNGNANASAITTSPPSTTRVFMAKNPKSGIRVLGNEQLQIRRYEPLRDEIIIDFEAAYERLHISSGETGWANAGASLAALTASSLGYFVGCVGIGSESYDGVKIGTIPGDNILKLIRRQRIAANVNGRSYSHPTIWHTAHEGWVNTAQATIVSAIVAGQILYTTEINKITGTTGEVIWLIDGLASSGYYNAEPGATQTTPVVPYAVLQAAVANPTKIVAVCPRYFLEHLSDDVHLTAEGCLLRGEYFARAQKRALASENALPVYMTSAVRTGAVILVTFNLWPGYEPLHFNDDIVTDPGNEGVEYIDVGGNAAAIAPGGLVWVDVNQLEITLDMVPTGTSPVIRIASQAIDDTGPTAGPRSRISDTAPDGFHNYAWPQEIAVTT